MSRTIMYQVNSDGTITHYRDFSNSWRGAMCVWQEMKKHYIGGDELSFQTDWQPVWDLWKDKALPDAHRIVMASTFDRVIVKRENIAKLISAIREYATDFDPGSLLQQVQALEDLLEKGSAIGVCWNQTSVSMNPWVAYDECPTCGQNYEESRPYNINTEKDHWFLFDSIDLS